MAARNITGLATLRPAVKDGRRRHGVPESVSAAQVDAQGQPGAVSFLASEDARLLDRRLRRIEQLLELLPLLLSMAGIDPTHVPIEVAAIALGVSVPTIRRRIRRGELRLDLLAGTKRSGIPIADLYQLWTPIHVARAALARERSAMEDERGTHPKTRRAVGG